MSLNKSIRYGKEKRKPYHGCKAVDSGCRNHGSCLWCEENRKYGTSRRLQKAKEDGKVETEEVGGDIER